MGGFGSKVPNILCLLQHLIHFLFESFLQVTRSDWKQWCSILESLSVLLELESESRKPKGTGIRTGIRIELCPTTDLFPISTYTGCNRLMYNPEHLLLCVPISTGYDPDQLQPIQILGRYWFFLYPRNIGRSCYRLFTTQVLFIMNRWPFLGDSAEMFLFIAWIELIPVGNFNCLWTSGKISLENWCSWLFPGSRGVRLDSVPISVYTPKGRQSMPPSYFCSIFNFIGTQAIQTRFCVA